MKHVTLHDITFVLMLWISHQLVMVVDARDPLFYRCPDLEVRSFYTNTSHVYTFIHNC